jgi:hypothetical protein
MSLPAASRFLLFRSVCLLLSGVGVLISFPVHAAPPGHQLLKPSSQTTIIVDSTNVYYTFGGQMVFTLAAHAPVNLTEATLLVRLGADSRTEVISAQFDPESKIDARVAVDLQAQPVQPFATVYYHWQIADSSGNTLTTDERTVWYEDNRFAWKTATRGVINAHWYTGDLSFGQALADRGFEALNRASRLMAAEPPDQLDIYVYETVSDLQSGLRLGGREWVGGHADPRLGVVMVYGINDPLDLIRLESDLSHELTHVMVYQIVGPGYGTTPVWLDEGLAINAEPQPNPQYTDALTTAVQSDALESIQVLCTSFGIDPNRAILSYAESASLVRYLQDRFGPQDIQKLLAAYRDGATCDGGVRRVLNLSLPELQSDWENDVLRASPFTKLFRQTLPYLIIFGPVLLVVMALVFIPKRKK